MCTMKYDHVCLLFPHSNSPNILQHIPFQFSLSPIKSSFRGKPTTLQSGIILPLQQPSTANSPSVRGGAQRSLVLRFWLTRPCAAAIALSGLEHSTFEHIFPSHPPALTLFLPSPPLHSLSLGGGGVNVDSPFRDENSVIYSQHFD